MALECTVPDIPSLREKFTRLVSDESYEKGLSFQPRPADVIIVAPPKCGTTWMMQIIHQMRTGGNMDFDTIHEVIPWFEVAHDAGVDLDVEQKAKPRVYKTHTPYNSCPKGGKYIVVFRDPRSAAYSFYKFYVGTFLPDDLPLKEFICELWLKMGDPPTQNIPWNVSYFTHLLSWMEHRNDPNVLIVFFEEMKEDLENVVRAVASFLDMQDEEKIGTALKMSTFEFMKAREVKFEGKPIPSPQFVNCRMQLVRTGSTTEALEMLDDDLKAAIKEGWEKEITKSTGYQTYEDLRRELRKECPFKY